MDVLSDVLRAVRLNGAVYFDIDAGYPWTGESPGTAEIATAVMPGVEHVISFHAILSGSCWAALSDGSSPALNLNAGDVVVFPGGAANVLGSEAGARGEPDMAMYYKPVDKHLPFTLIRGGEGQERTRFVCGYLGCDARPFNPLLAALPPMLRVSRPTDGGRWVTDLFSMALKEGGSGRAGGETVLAKLSELMFVEVIRCYVETLPARVPRVAVRLARSAVGKALRLIHARPARGGPWSGFHAKPGSRAPSSLSVFPTMSAFPRCTISRAGAFSSRVDCWNSRASASRARRLQSAMNPRRPSIARLRSLSAFPQARGGRGDCCRPNPSLLIPFEFHLRLARRRRREKFDLRRPRPCGKPAGISTSGGILRSRSRKSTTPHGPTRDFRDRDLQWPLHRRKATFGLELLSYFIARLRRPWTAARFSAAVLSCGSTRSAAW